MQINKPNLIEQIETRICELQKSYVSLQEQLKNSQNNFEHSLDDSALRIIDILDMINMAKLNMDLDCEANSNAQLIIKKIEKRITDVLRRLQVQEIIFTDGRIAAGKARVLETRKVSGETPTGTIIEVCRKGYQRGDKIIRPADVITAEVKL
jgi:molecular chaperone GrpE (heat shock protein)